MLQMRSTEAGEDYLAQVQCFIDDGHAADEGGIERLRELLERASQGPCQAKLREQAWDVFDALLPLAPSVAPGAETRSLESAVDALCSACSARELLMMGLEHVNCVDDVAHLSHALIMGRSTGGVRAPTRNGSGGGTAAVENHLSTLRGLQLKLEKLHGEVGLLQTNVEPRAERAGRDCSTPTRAYRSAVSGQSSHSAASHSADALAWAECDAPSV